ncbi:MAG: hypothetical protein E5V22_11985 [Mesorhizobium sp.]|nr:MAG: hypothetical protein E5V22_11985 [Mesorhizobium sp.]
MQTRSLYKRKPKKWPHSKDQLGKILEKSNLIPRESAITKSFGKYRPGIVPAIPSVRRSTLSHPVTVERLTPSNRASSARLPFANNSVTYCKGELTVIVDIVC